MQELLDAWNALIARHTQHPSAAEAGRALLEAWSEPHRTYHSVTHLRQILVCVEELAGHADDADAVRFAAWYHDCVYQCRPDDEERSAVHAEQDLSRLGVAAPLVDEVARLVRMTVGHDPAPGDRNGEVLSDADLAALALPAESYRRNTASIRAEYAHVPEDLFRTGRRLVLHALLDSPSIFRTEPGRQRWEAAAQRNLQAELADLSD